jgi:hypothetical protein
MARSAALCVAAFSSLFAVLSAQSLPPVYFNHATIHLPSAAYAAVAHSLFLRDEFGAFQEQTVQRDGGTWSYSGIYIFGQHTYLELFQAGAETRRDTTVIRLPGQIGFNMWIDDRGRLPLFSERLATEKGIPMLIDTTRDGNNLPAYDGIIPKGGLANYFGPEMLVGSILKGYYPDGITREKRLASRFLPERLLHDVIGFTLTVNDAERRRLIQEFRVYGYTISGEGQKETAIGPGITVTLLPAQPNKARTLVIDMSLNHEVAVDQAYKLGAAGNLRTQANAASWALTFSNTD